ncbi:MAG: hypothetical protein COW03_17260 [Cytophagales bacterium CG12_big_fil_rev_8_21_14_0_65_40_12]|nr:MAG: hypothetical protein COW03_17260 [Cytophagales bacterium CG12_big_fil_rev_8_21_14_0_65_40_12]PIW02956.1 MAG: hypothetical protein COW40_16525 [Cytophagales bacterium CG17_big_fil_post_rev_8_21_14_2_50_40_13]
MEEQITTGQVIKKWGIIYGAIGTVVNLIPMLMELQPSWLQIVNIVIAIAMYILACKEFKTENGGLMSFGEGFRISLGAAAIAGVMRSVISYIYIKFIDPEYMERMKQIMNDTWREQGMTEEQIEQSSRFMSGFSNPELGLILGVVVVVLGGLIWGAIVSAIMKNGEDEY